MKRPPFELIDLVNSANVGMVQRRGGLRFAFESLQRELVLCQIFRKEFQRHKTPQLDIFGLIDNTHPAAAQLFHDAVMRNGLPN